MEGTAANIQDGFLHGVESGSLDSVDGKYQEFLRFYIILSPGSGWFPRIILIGQKSKFLTWEYQDRHMLKYLLFMTLQIHFNYVWPYRVWGNFLLLVLPKNTEFALTRKPSRKSQKGWKLNFKKSCKFKFQFWESSVEHLNICFQSEWLNGWRRFGIFHSVTLYWHSPAISCMQDGLKMNIKHHWENKVLTLDCSRESALFQS